RRGGGSCGDGAGRPGRVRASPREGRRLLDGIRSLGRRVARGEVWIAAVGRKRRPVLVLTRTEVLDVRALVTVAEISTSVRGLAVEVEVDHDAVGLDRACVVNCDGLHTVAQSVL